VQVLHVTRDQLQLLTRKGVLVEEQRQTTLADDDSDSDEARVLKAVACRRVYLPHRLRPARGAKGADGAGCYAQGRGL